MINGQNLNHSLLCFPFCKVMKINYGKAIYLIGSISTLGEWDLTKAIRLVCYQGFIWKISVQIPYDASVQYKYFISEYDKIHPKSVQWIGKGNLHLRIYKQLKQRTKLLTLMSFNIRYQNERDIGVISWQNRKQHCVQIIKQKLPYCVGIQQARTTQKDYMFNKLKYIYDYVGVPRDGRDGEQCGIFIRKDKFAIIEHKFVWLSESRQPFSIGYDSYFPRYCTFTVLLDLQVSIEKNNYIIVANLHLDQIGKLARKNGILIILDIFKEMKKKYNNLGDCFFMGDFNSPQNDPIFDVLKSDQEFNFQSLRLISPKSSKIPTFNGFTKTELQTFNQYEIIDHIFSSLVLYRPVLFDVLICPEIASDHNAIYAELERCNQQSQRQ